MSLSVVVNSAAEGEKAAHVPSSGGVEHGKRQYLLNTWILPRLIQDPAVDEVIVAGEWHEGEEWTYVEAPSRHFGAEDALHQRQAGAEVASGDRIIFQHDDHILGPEAAERVRSYDEMEVASPARYTRMRDPRGERLNGGWTDDYLHGHAIGMSREALEAVPWRVVPKVFTWDVAHTRLLKEAGCDIRCDEHFRIFDVEMGSEPWR